VQGIGFKVQGSRFKVQGSRFKVQGSRFKVQGSRFNKRVPLTFSILNRNSKLEYVVLTSLHDQNMVLVSR
jgi:hypothetical protein